MKQKICLFLEKLMHMLNLMPATGLKKMLAHTKTCHKTIRTHPSPGGQNDIFKSLHKYENKQQILSLERLQPEMLYFFI